MFAVGALTVPQATLPPTDLEGSATSTITTSFPQAALLVGLGLISLLGAVRLAAIEDLLVTANPMLEMLALELTARPGPRIARTAVAELSGRSPEPVDYYPRSR